MEERQQLQQHAQQQVLKQTTSTSKYIQLMKTLSSGPVGVLVTAAVMILLSVAVSAFSVPNPNMILITGLVICASVFGWPGGLTAAVVMMAYTLYFFSTGNSFISFTGENMQKVIVSFIGIVVVGFFVSALRAIISREFRHLEFLNAELEEDNNLLQKATTIDTLTNTNNRFGLHRDFSNYLNTNMRVMMMDIDSFKEINDQFGHHMGDYVLSQVGAHLADIFGTEFVYRYGGDEFLIMRPNVSDSEFTQLTERLRQEISGITLEDTGKTVFFSAGYTYGTPTRQSDLRSMIRLADKKLYESKNAGKNRITGCKFSRSKSHAATQSKGAREAIESNRGPIQ